MSWETIATLRLTQAWTFTPAFEGEWFKFILVDAPDNLPIQICQGDPYEGIYIESATLRSDYPQIIHLPVPTPVPEIRKIGLRARNSDKARASNLTVFVLRYMPLIPPQSSSIASSQTSSYTINADSSESQVLLASNPNRIGAMIWNNSSGRLYLDFDEVVTNANYAIRLDPSAGYEIPYGYTGTIAGIWSNNNGFALIREFLP